MTYSDGGWISGGTEFGSVVVGVEYRVLRGRGGGEKPVFCWLGVGGGGG